MASIKTAKAEAAKVAQTKKAKAETTTRVFEQGGMWLVHLPNEKLRRFLLDHSVVNWQVMNYEDLHDEDDTKKQRDKKDRMALYPLSQFTDQQVQQMLLARVNYAKRTPEVAADYEALVKLVREAEERLKVESAEALEKGTLTFDQMTRAFRENMLLAVKHDGQTLAMQVKSAQLQRGFFGPYLEIRGTVYGWNGVAVAAGKHSISYSPFKGERTFEELGIVVLTPTVKDQLIQRGKKHIQVSKQPTYAMHTGSILAKAGWFTQSFNATGRLMVDMLSMKRANPNFRSWPFGISPMGEDDWDEDDQKTLREEDLTEDVLACMSPYAMGFSFVSKAWGQIKVSNLSDVNFRHDAWEKLVLNQNDKNMIQALVQAENLHSIDLIEGKGGGVIFLLAGEPGGGKTLTAESIAEELRRPLYAVGIGELGTDVDQLEQNLTRILETAAAWKAVLLLDEADIFLEERSDLNIERNAMVGVFLRLLEYYPGILFLTSNRAKRIDRAFYSRISLALHYSPLGEDARVSVWRNLISKQVESGKADVDLSDRDYVKLAGFGINGRQIKNAIRIGITLAAQQGRAAGVDDFVGVIQRMEAFELSNK